MVRHHLTKDITNLPVLDSPKTKNLKRKLADMSEAYSTIKKEMKRQKLITPSLRDVNTLPTFPKALVRMQLSHKKRSRWLTDEKVTALSIFYKSPSTYRFMRAKGMMLPSTSTLSTWLK